MPPIIHRDHHRMIALPAKKQSDPLGAFLLLATLSAATATGTTATGRTSPNRLTADAALSALAAALSARWPKRHGRKTKRLHTLNDIAEIAAEHSLKRHFL